MMNELTFRYTNLIREIGDVITAVDVLRSQYSRDTSKRKQLDDIRDYLDTLLRKLVRNQIKNITNDFINNTDSLKLIIKELDETVKDLNQLAKTIETLVNFINVLQKIVALIP